MIKLEDLGSKPQIEALINLSYINKGIVPIIENNFLDESIVCLVISKGRFRITKLGLIIKYS